MWQIRIDTGGTFTDCWAIPPGKPEPVFVKVLSSGRLRLALAQDGQPVLPAAWKLGPDFLEGWTREPLSESVADFFTGEEAPVIGARVLTGTRLTSPFPEIDLRLATTRGTNALLEGKGADIAFFVTEGFGDLLRIRDQRRPDLFALHHRIPPPLYRKAIEVPGRLDADGAELEPLVLDEAFLDSCRKITDQGIRGAAVALLHSYTNPAHEEALASALREQAGFDFVSLSSDLAPLIKILPRAETAVIDAYLTPVMEAFLDNVATVVTNDESEPLAGSTTSKAAKYPELLVMTSAGGLEPRSRFRPKDCLFSGPAGGVVGAAAIGRACGHEKLITFDMGGTSTDVARYDGDFAYQFEQHVGHATLLSPALRIETVAAGGGSICHWTGAGLRVGPESAGADPGPACYGRGGPLTITDVNLLLGRIDPERFGIPLGLENVAAAQARLEELRGQMPAPAGDRELLNGLLEIAVEQMADSIRTISIREGADPSDYALLAFGGAGPLHACDIAEKLGMETILIPAEAGVLSAYGLDQAVVERFAERQILQPLNTCQDHLSGWLEALREEAVWDAGEPLVTRRRMAELRLLGQEATLMVELPPEESTAELMRPLFLDRYETIFGYRLAEEATLELVTLRVVISTAPKAHIAPDATNSQETWRGPRIIQDEFSTLYLKTGWSALRHGPGTLRCRRESVMKESRSALNTPDSITTELFRHRFEALVREMGAMLERSAISTNVRERLDFSCALLDAEGQLVVNAPHIPVHLGALGLCVREVEAILPMEPDDMVVTNHPGFGGSHLPDVTVISPVFVDDKRIGYVANRAHHAEIGGIRPGSMPPDARHLCEEGVVIPPAYLFRRGKERYAALTEQLTGAIHPTRNLRDNLADLQAQAAANLRGVETLARLSRSHGAEVLREHLTNLADQSHRSFQHALAAQPLAQTTAEETLDDGTRIVVTSRREDGRFILDFAGTSPVHPGNLNATPAIVRSAVLYALRLWTGSDLPMNEGLLRDVEILLPPASFLNPDFPEDPARCPAVVGGNVETSQRLVDTLLQLFGVQACSQGTMNNFIFGNDRFGYYETIAGGAGAGPDHDGASGIHTHMTNTAITDPEILERRYPVRLRCFSLRAGSGGAGRFHGGDGVIRDVEFLAPLEVSLLTQHRVAGPYGWAGGDAGSPGQQTWIPADGRKRQLPSIAAVQVKPGDRIRIETPGGGGWGKG